MKNISFNFSLVNCAEDIEFLIMDKPPPR